MKKMSVTLMMIGAALLANHANAQISLSINLGRPPVIVAAPQPMMVAGPDMVDASGYYYYPDINCYYDIANSGYIYYYGNQWLFANSIPPMYRGYDFGRNRMMLNRDQFYARHIPMGGYYGNRGGERMYAGNYNRGMMNGYNRGMVNGGGREFAGGPVVNRMPQGGGRGPQNFGGGRGNNFNRGGMNPGRGGNGGERSGRF